MNILIQSISGLGLFLLGMVIMTDALRLLTGEMIRSTLLRYTKDPLSGAVTGALSTAILQSSSATTVAAVGFVGAGLLTFSQSLGIIFGANIGTTITGWLVALIGFKFKLAVVMQPIIFLGVALRVFGAGRLANIGMAIAGFGLIFVGISVMQAGMNDLQPMVTPDIFPENTFFGRLQLVGIGILITIVTQSSSAGVAATLTALFTGAIGFEQAAPLVIGMDVGTTITTMIATIGSSTGAKRTGFSHVIYNVITAIGALIILPLYIVAWDFIAPEQLIPNAELALVGFHSLFNLLGVIIILPFTSSFGKFIQAIIPDKVDAYTKSLDKHFLIEPDLALTAAQTSIGLELKALFRQLITLLEPDGINKPVNINDLHSALDQTRTYIDLVHLEKSKEKNWKILTALIHSLDHMQRLYERCEEDKDRALVAHRIPEITDHIDDIKIGTQRIIVDIENNDWIDASRCANQFTATISKEAKQLRRLITSKIARGEMDTLEGTDCLKAIRWLRRVCAHILRITHHQTKVFQAFKEKEKHS